MRALLLDGVGRPPRVGDRPAPEPGPDDVLIEVAACGLCRTDLHIADGEVAAPAWPVVPGHQAVGRVLACTERAGGLVPGDRVGVPWLGWTCRECAYCRSGRENLCPHARFTGLHRGGGLAERMVADARYCLRIPACYDDVQAAPLLCAGLIGYRTLKLAGEARRVGLYGFGAAGHLVIQLARAQGREVYAFTRASDAAAQDLARRLGATWTGGSGDRPPERLDAALLFAPDGALVPAALAALVPGGRVVCGGIHMSDIPSFPYRLLWEERTITSVANLTRADGEEFFALAARVPLEAAVTRYALADAPRAFADLRERRLTGAAVIVPHA